MSIKILTNTKVGVFTRWRTCGLHAYRLYNGKSNEQGIWVHNSLLRPKSGGHKLGPYTIIFYGCCDCPDMTTEDDQRVPQDENSN